MRQPRLTGLRRNLTLAFSEIFDRRLYKLGFMWQSLFFLGFIFIIPAYVFYLLSWPLAFIYLAGFLAYFLISGLFSKNFNRKETHSIPYLTRFLFVLTSGLSFGFFFLLTFQTGVNNLYQTVLLFMIPMLSLLIAVIEVTIPGQRLSLRRHIGLTDSFIDKQKEIWRKALENFPNSEKIIDELDSGRHVGKLFDRGIFSLSTLWACNVMEEIINASADEICRIDATKKALFKNELGRPKRLPTQLSNLGYVHRQISCRKEEQLSPNDLWDTIRNPIAHHNHKTSFSETYGSLMVFVAFVEDFPQTLQNWMISNKLSN